MNRRWFLKLFGGGLAGAAATRLWIPDGVTSLVVAPMLTLPRDLEQAVNVERAGVVVRGISHYRPAYDDYCVRFDIAGV